MATTGPLSLASSGQFVLGTLTTDTQMLLQRIHENLRNIQEPTIEADTDMIAQRIISNLKKIPEPALPKIRPVLSNSTYSKSSPSSQCSSSPGLFVTPEGSRCSSPFPEREEDLSLPLWPTKQCDYSKELDHLFSPSLSPSEFSDTEYRAPIAPMGIPATNDNFEIDIRAPSWSPITPICQVKDNRVFIDHDPRVFPPPSWSPFTPKAQSPKHMFPSRQHPSDDPIDEDALDLGAPMIPINTGDGSLTHIEHNCQGKRMFWTKEEYTLEGLKWAEETTRLAIKRYEIKKAHEQMRVAKRREEAEKRRKRVEIEEKLRAAKRIRVSGSRLRQATEKRKLWEAEMEEEEMKRVAKRMRVSGSRLRQPTVNAKMWEVQFEWEDEQSDEEEIRIRKEKDDEYERSDRDDSHCNMEDDEEEASEDED